MRALLLAGGKATRLRPLTERMPKAMTPLLGRPFLEHLLGWLVRHDVRDVTLLLGFLPGPIQSYFGDGARWGVRLSYLVEEQPLGSGGAIKQVEAELTETFLALNADIFSTAALDRLVIAHRRAAADVTIALQPVDDPSSYGVVALDEAGRVTAFVEKPAPEEAPSNLINAGIWALEPGALGRIAAGRFTMVEHELFPALAREGRLSGAVVEGYWLDAGTPERYLQLHRDLLAGRVAGVLPLVEQRGWPGLRVPPTGGAPAEEGRPPRLGHGAAVCGPVVLGADVVLEAGAVVEGPASIGAGCRLGAGSRVTDAVLWEDCSVGEHSVITASILATGCRVGARAHLTDCVLGDGVQVSDGARAHGLRVPPGGRVAGDPAIVTQTD
jgi:mannose-1-phosphate guanylyltransferase